MKDLVIEVRGGVVQQVYCNNSNIRVVLVDWDDVEPPEPAERAGRIWGRCAKLRDLPDDTRAQFLQAADKDV